MKIASTTIDEVIGRQTFLESRCKIVKAFIEVTTVLLRDPLFLTGIKMRPIGVETDRFREQVLVRTDLLHTLVMAGLYFERIIDSIEVVGTGNTVICSITIGLSLLTHGKKIHPCILQDQR